ncbi:sulfite exporter TauE/SafE family protein [Natronococcus sp.]|uniref:sulfite exporter TauE/SafE family protein n=1 Tax=Natronococcus sp. TaxID=35747 RepID=UPI0025CEFDCF|nr:sulfite exporter TauE/SafE family protein [Natronococcus sp.]
MIPVPLEILLALLVVALLSGIGCTTVGAGGIFVTIALYLLTPLSSTEVAGTAHVLFVLVGVIGVVGYARSGELVGPEGRALATVLAGSSVPGALAGAFLNAFVSRRLFGVLLGILIVCTGILLAYRRLRGLPSLADVDPESRGGRLVFAGTGLALGTVAGLVGVGGAVLAVPTLVVLGVPMLVALGVAQLQAIFISGFAVGGYYLQDAVSVALAGLLAVPIVVGAVAGWLVAHRVDPVRLEIALGFLLIPTGIYLIL